MSRCDHLVNPGLIPAWAGKTKAGRVPQNERWAHPRVGGENVSVVAFASLPGGSSPRGRGKPVSAVLVGPSGRLIPAWAGKTSASTGRTQRRRAHPRVGGENPHPLSSPSSFIRLIPAWAGKTGVSAGALEGGQAHPRVGGENATPAGMRTDTRGSSPRGRGKRVFGEALLKQCGLIPAWAGKTPSGFPLPVT